MNNFEDVMKFARDLFADLERHWVNDPAGIYCPGYSLQENEAMDLFAKRAREMDMEVHVDLAGNNYFVMKGQNRTAPVFLSASHVDAVPQGGRYDGRAGVVAALTAAKYMSDNNIVPPQDFVAAVWRNEESAWFGSDCVGSRLAVGGQGLADDFLEAAMFRKLEQYPDAPVMLSEHMLAAGINFDDLKIAFGQPLFPLEAVGGGMEVHIEQGPFLLHTNKSIGIVTAIRGNMRTPENVHFHGQPDHSGACPMDLRKDAERACSATQEAFYKAMDDFVFLGDDLTVTVPGHMTPDFFSTSVCQHAWAKFEVRSTSMQTLAGAKEALIQISREKAEAANVRLLLNPDDIKISPPALMDKRMVRLAGCLASKLDIPHQYMPSGAGHDTGILAKAGIPVSMIFIRHAGRSHLSAEYLGRTPDEDPYVAGSDFANGIRVLVHAAQIPLFQAASSHNNKRTFAEQIKIDC